MKTVCLPRKLLHLVHIYDLLPRSVDYRYTISLWSDYDLRVFVCGNVVTSEIIIITSDSGSDDLSPVSDDSQVTISAPSQTRPLYSPYLGVGDAGRCVSECEGWCHSHPATGHRCCNNSQARVTATGLWGPHGETNLLFSFIYKPSRI